MASYQYSYVMKNLTKSYPGGRDILKGVTLSFLPDVKIGVLGVNGAGKSTLLKIMAGQDTEFGGEAWAADGVRVGYLEQEPSVFRKLTVEDNLRAVLEFTGLSKKEQHEKMESLMEEFSITHVRKNIGMVLSGGERRRTEIARALAVDPDFILLDEPFAGVDPIAVEEIQTIVSRLKKRNIGILITDHNVQETLSITDRAYLMFEGKLLKSGTAEDLAADEQVRRVYLGKHFELKRKF